MKASRPAKGLLLVWMAAFLTLTAPAFAQQPDRDDLICQPIQPDTAIVFGHRG
jgi:hypothetical protein